MAKLRGIQATNMRTLSGSEVNGEAVVIMPASESVDAPYVIESVWLRVTSGSGELQSGGLVLCRTSSVRLDVTCNSIFRPAESDLTLSSDLAAVDYSITIRWL